jgi:DNA-directed RNA polymerase subunit RPC12/RpoP
MTEYICLDCGDYFTSANKPKCCPHCISDRLVALTYQPKRTEEELERAIIKAAQEVAGFDPFPGERL